MHKNKKIILGIVGIIVLVGVFYGGISYGKNSTATALNTNGAGENRTGQFGGAMNNRGSRTSGSGFVSGKIISKDANSITLEILSGDPTLNGATNPSGSKIIFVDTSTTVSKMATGSLNDLTTGTQVSVTGTTNPDGSVTAKSVQIRPQTRQNTPAQ